MPNNENENRQANFRFFKIKFNFLINDHALSVLEIGTERELACKSTLWIFPPGRRGPSKMAVLKPRIEQKEGKKKEKRGEKKGKKKETGRKWWLGILSPVTRTRPRVRARGRSRSSRKGEPMGAENTLRDTGWSFSHSGARSTRGLDRSPVTLRNSTLERKKKKKNRKKRKKNAHFLAIKSPFKSVN